MNERKSHPSDDVLQRRIVSQLNKQADQLDPATRHALDRARRKALDMPATDRAGWWISGGWIAAPALIAAALVLALAIKQVSPDTAIEPLPMTADLDIITDPRFELLVEDPDFIAWLAEAETSDAGPEHSG